MKIEKIPAGIYAVNCYVLICEETKKAAIIDPGGDADEILTYIERNHLDLSYILLTHGHGDHIGGVQTIKEKANVPVCIHPGDGSMLKDANKNLSSMMSGPNVEIEADRLLEDGEIIELGNLKIQIIHTPGHTLGGICMKVEDTVFSGDTLFARSIGRTDFEGGSHVEIIHSIKNKLMIFDDETKVFPGHGPMTTIGNERVSNPFINE